MISDVIELCGILSECLTVSEALNPLINNGVCLPVVRRKGDRHCSHPGAHQRPETWSGSHQGTVTLSVSLCVCPLMCFSV